MVFFSACENYNCSFDSTDRMSPILTTHLYLYGTAACHLCEEAAALLGNLYREAGFTWSEIDIAEDHDLLQRYGLKIPVLHHVDKAAELCWPFSTTDILAFVR